MSWVKAVLISTFLTFLISLSLYAQVKSFSAEQINDLADEYVSQYFERYPEVATIRGIQNADHSSIRDPSIESISRWNGFVDSLYSRLELLEAPKLAGSDYWVTYGHLRQLLETDIQTRVCREELWKVDQINGWQAGISNLAIIQPVGTESLRKAALQRFGSLQNYIRSHIENLREGLTLGYSAPKENVKRVLEQVEQLLDVSPEQSPLYDSARRDSTRAFQEAFAKLIVESINPAIEEYRDFLRDEYLPKVRTQAALSTNPGGADCYRARIREHTTIDMPPEEIHQLGLQMVDRLKTEIQKIESDSSKKLATPEFFIGRLKRLEAAEASLERAQAEVSNWFESLPATGVIVDPLPSHLEDSGPAGRYINGAEDGSSPARFQINLRMFLSRSSLEKLSFHEAIPGHHLQRALAMENTSAHPITRYFGYNVFNEGWALYAETLADEMGLYTSNRSRLIILRSQLMKAHNLVLDTGLHVMGWTRPKAIDYLIKEMGANSRNAARLIDQIIIWPGQTISYLLGYYEIQRLRTLAETKLEGDFDIAQFHDLVLSDGSITLPMLREKIERWISSY